MKKHTVPRCDKCGRSFEDLQPSPIPLCDLHAPLLQCARHIRKTADEAEGAQ
jgi:hypothetical protein